MLESAPAEQDFFWDDLLEFIDEHRVIPALGAERLNVPNGAAEAGPPCRQRHHRRSRGDATPNPPMSTARITTAVASKSGIWRRLR